MKSFTNHLDVIAKINQLEIKLKQINCKRVQAALIYCNKLLILISKEFTLILNFY